MRSSYLWPQLLLLARASDLYKRQDEPEPDRRRRARQSAAVLGNYLYLNGGGIAQLDVEAYSVALNGTYSIPLDVAWETSSVEFNYIDDQEWPLSKAYTALWADPESNIMYRWAGEHIYQDPVDDAPLLEFTPDNRGGGTWSNSTPANPEVFDSIYRAKAGASIVCGGYGMFVGGIAGGSTDPRFSDEVPVSGIAMYDLSTRTWSNESIAPFEFDPGTIFNGQAACATGFNLDALVVLLGGNESPLYPPGLSTREMRRFGNVTFYDPAENRWYWQQTLGSADDIPSRRDFFCAVGMRGSSSYEIFIYGGRSREETGNVVHGDMWVLSLPAFQWFRLDVEAPARMHHVCAVRGRHMFVSGGLSQSLSWGEEDEWENSLDVFDLASLRWISSYDPEAEYETPALVERWYASNPDPVDSLNDSVRDIFAIPQTSPTPTASPSPDSSTPVGAIVGGVVGGVVAILLIVVAIVFLRRRKHSPESNPHGIPRSNRESDTPFITQGTKPGSPEFELQGISRSELAGSQGPLSELPSDVKRVELQA